MNKFNVICMDIFSKDETKFVFCDVDDTVLSFGVHFEEWVRNQGYNPQKTLMETYSIENWINVSKEGAAKLLHEFNDSEFMHDQPPEPCAKDVIPLLYSEGYKFLAITACGLDEGFRQKRWRTLEKTFGIPFEDVRVVDYRECKLPVLKEYDSAIWVEDNFSHAVKGAEIGHRTFLLTRPYNVGLEHPKVTRVKDWWGIYEILKGD